MKYTTIYTKIKKVYQAPSSLEGFQPDMSIDQRHLLLVLALALLAKERSYYTGCPRRNVPDFGRVFLMLKYTDITQNTYIQS